ncbi:hypothetical protein ACROYT_G017277 [Oculina patagonica]
MDNPRIGSLNSLADYGLGESDIEDSDDELESKDNVVKPIVVPRPYVAQARVTSSARLVSYDDVAEEEEGGAGEGAENEESEKTAETTEDIDNEETVTSKDDEIEDSLKVHPAQEPMVISDVEEAQTLEEKDSEKAGDPDAAPSNTIPAITMPQLPPEPEGRCSNKLQEKILKLLEKKHRENLDLNTNIQNRKDFRNPSIYKKLVSFLNIDETGSNYPKSLFDPTCWTEDSYYENLSKAQKEAYERKEKEKAKQARTQVEFVSGTKKPITGEETKKRKSKWDVSAVPAPPVKTATPPTKVGVLGSGVTSTSDITFAAKKPKVS